MAKAKIGLYSVKGDQLTRTHRPCPKCGPGTFLAEHSNRRSCGKCGYAESRAASSPPKEPTSAPKSKSAKGAPAAPAPPAKAP